MLPEITTWAPPRTRIPALALPPFPLLVRPIRNQGKSHEFEVGANNVTSYCILFEIVTVHLLKLHNEQFGVFCIRRVCKFVFINIQNETNVYDSVHTENQLC